MESPNNPTVTSIGIKPGIKGLYPLVVGGKLKAYRTKIGGQFFSLGSDQQRAELLFYKLQSHSFTIKSVLSDSDLETIRAIIRGEVRAIHQPAPDQRTATIPPTDLHRIAQRYRTHLSQRVAAGEVTMNYLIDFNMAWHWWDCASLSPVDLSSWVGRIKSRPVGRKNKAKISAHTARNIIKNVQAFLTWADDMELIQLPRKFDRIFSVSVKKMQSDNERAKGKTTWTVDEIRRVYEDGSKNVRAYILLMINCGYTAVDISTLRAEHLKEKDGWIIRHRNKTGCDQSHKLWPETVAAIAKARQQSGEWVFRTQDGNPLVWLNETTRMDSVRSAIQKVTRKLEIKGKAPKHLRKTGATLIAKQYGNAVAQQYLAHSPTTMAEQAYIQADHTKLDEATDWLRGQVLGQ